MAGSKRTCAACGNKFIGGIRALYCSTACKQRAHRSRKGADRNGHHVTVTDPAPKRSSKEAVELLGALDAELESNAKQLGLSLKWSAAERAVLGLIGDTVDRRAELQRLYEEASDLTTKLKISAELRLVEQAAARLLARIRTELPASPGLRTVNAQRAARSRWDRGANATS